MNAKHARHHRYMLIVVILAMGAIVSVWSIWFFPNTGRNESGDAAFSGFARDVLKTFSVFAPEEPVREEKINLDEMRAKVFGDKINR